MNEEGETSEVRGACGLRRAREAGSGSRVHALGLAHQARFGMCVMRVITFSLFANRRTELHRAVTMPSGTGLLARLAPPCIDLLNLIVPIVTD